MKYQKRNLRNKKLLIIVIGYVFICITFWLSNKFFGDSNYKIAKNLDLYIDNHRSEITDKMFMDIFSNALICRKLNSQEEIEKCEQNTQIALANLLQEEELVVSGSWPNDLFFVKQTGKNTYKLGWDGKLVDITEQIKNSPRPTTLHRLWSLLSKSHCNYFHAIDNTTWQTCEIVVPVQLASGDTGYLVRIDSVVEEDLLLFYLAYPLFPIFAFLSYLVQSIGIL